MKNGYKGDESIMNMTSMKDLKAELINRINSMSFRKLKLVYAYVNALTGAHNDIKGSKV